MSDDISRRAMEFRRGRATGPAAIERNEGQLRRTKPRTLEPTRRTNRHGGNPREPMPTRRGPGSAFAAQHDAGTFLLDAAAHPDHRMTMIGGIDLPAPVRHSLSR